MAEIAVSQIAPARLAADIPTGFFITFRPAGLKMLSLNWEGSAYGLYLEDKEFRFFPIKAGVSVRGALIQDVEFRVDLDSAYDAVQKSDPLGALILTGGQLFVVGVRIGDGFEDPVEVPLWGEFLSLTSEEKVGFTRWSIVARDGDEWMKLFSYEAAAIE